jgi:hypothetical protein
VGIDDGRADREAETKTVLLGRIERLEQSALLVGRDTAALIGHTALDKAILYRPCRQRQQASPRRYRAHRVRGIHRQIEQNLLQLDRVSDSQREVLGQVKLNCDPA